VNPPVFVPIADYMAAFTAAISPPSPKAFLGDVEGPRAGHTPYTASWTSTLTRSGQIHSWRANTSPHGKRPSGGVPLPTHLRPAWNERIPVWERRIPQWETSLGAPVSRVPPGARASFNPYSSEVSTTSAAKSQIVTRDWSLLFSPGRVDTLIRRPWPEYEPESSAAVGRRWSGCNLGRLYEHVVPSPPPSASGVSVTGSGL